ncbi:hypothetical protein [uncultured Ramlibacter sp.]|uniref:hypothetical protein n=1 Tax=uncultured Ramlibacter sp. TaxID=260755 RepID=UPI002608C030|nr:hypothetical protein [uncultured Ramlibacter sp.]
MLEHFVQLALSAFVPLVLVATFIFIIRTNRKQMAAMQAQSFAAYKQAHPGRVSHDGHVRCKECGGGNIGIERVMNRTFMRRHFCRTDGTTLYYSKEQT